MAPSCNHLGKLIISPYLLGSGPVPSPLGSCAHLLPQTLTDFVVGPHPLTLKKSAERRGDLEEWWLGGLEGWRQGPCFLNAHIHFEQDRGCELSVQGATGLGEMAVGREEHGAAEDSVKDAAAVLGTTVAGQLVAGIPASACAPSLSTKPPFSNVNPILSL